MPKEENDLRITVLSSYSPTSTTVKVYGILPSKWYIVVMEKIHTYNSL